MPAPDEGDAHVLSAPPPPTYANLDALHRFLADGDAPGPRPWLVSFDGDDLLVLVGLRPFGPGQYEGPLVEAMALVLPIGADRVSVALPSRVWSVDDPVPPVTADADLRQRVLTQVTVDGHDRATPDVRTRLQPFRVPPGRADITPLVWDEVVDPGPGEGWVPEALAAMVAGRDRIGVGSSVREHRQQLWRLDDLGHEVLLTPAGRGRLGL